MSTERNIEAHSSASSAGGGEILKTEQPQGKWREYLEQCKNDQAGQVGDHPRYGHYVVGPDLENPEKLARYYRLTEDGRLTDHWGVVDLIPRPGNNSDIGKIEVSHVPDGVAELYPLPKPKSREQISTVATSVEDEPEESSDVPDWEPERGPESIGIDHFQAHGDGIIRGPRKPK